MDEKNDLKEVAGSDSVEADDTQAVSDAESADDNAHHHSSHHSHHGGHHHHHHSHHHGGHHHSGHHHHHSHHRHHHSSKKKNKKTISKFIRKHKHALVNVLCCVLCGIILVSYAFYNDYKTQNTPDDSSSGLVSSAIRIESTIFTEEIPLVSQALLEYMDVSNNKSAKEIYERYNGKEIKLNIGFPIRYSYKVLGLASGMDVTKSAFEVSENESFQNAITYNFSDARTTIDVYNLKPNTHYYYRLKLTLSTGNVVGATGDFKTAYAPRVLSIDGAVNVRDIGGWNTSSGKQIKYGLLYRGSELDGAYESTFLLTESGKKEMESSLGIKLDMDLRAFKENATKDVLGPNVQHKYYSIGQYAWALDSSQNSYIRGIFSDLANEENYPVYMHCTYGKDRTGTVCYLLEALLGVSDADLRRDYELSVFTYSDLEFEQFAVFVDRIHMMEGDTTQEKVEGYLLSIGVTAEEIASIRNIYLG